MANQSADARRTARKREASKQAWRDQVVFDIRLSGMTKAVAYAMAGWITDAADDSHLNDGEILVRGTQRTLADMVGCSTKTVHLAMTSLIEHGHVTLVRRPQNRDDTNLYRIIPLSASPSRGCRGRAAGTAVPVMAAPGA